MATDVTIPPLGESITEATVGQWLKSPGDAVKADEPIVSLETDKVAVEIPSPVDGVMGVQMVKVGDTVTIGATIARIEGAGATTTAAAPIPAVVQGPVPAAAIPTPAKPAEAAASPAPSIPPAAETPIETTAVQPDPTPAAPATPAPAPAIAPAAAAHADDDGPMAPAVRRLLEDHNLDPASVTGTGKDGRLTKADVQAAIAAGSAKARSSTTVAAAAPREVATVVPVPAAPQRSMPAVQDAPGRHEERVRMTRLRQTIARRLKEAQNTAAMLTTFNDVDMTAVMATRARYKDLFEKKHGVRLGFMSFFVKAVVLALRDVPAVNAAIEGDEIVYHDYADIGVAVSSPGGLVVPVLKDADKHNFAQIEKAIADFGKRAQAGKLALADMQGGTFTVTNGGVFGSLMSTPILNPPQSGVLGMHRIEDRPVVVGGQIVIRPMMYLALSYDHRIVDGREAVMFLVRVKEAIEDPTRLLVDL